MPNSNPRPWWHKPYRLLSMAATLLICGTVGLFSLNAYQRHRMANSRWRLPRPLPYISVAARSSVAGRSARDTKPSSCVQYGRLEPAIPASRKRCSGMRVRLDVAKTGEQAAPADLPQMRPVAAESASRSLLKAKLPELGRPRTTSDRSRATASQVVQLKESEKGSQTYSYGLPVPGGGIARRAAAGRMGGMGGAMAADRNSTKAEPPRQTRVDRQPIDGRGQVCCKGSPSRWCRNPTEHVRKRVDVFSIEPNQVAAGAVRSRRHRPGSLILIPRSRGRMLSKTPRTSRSRCKAKMLSKTPQTSRSRRKASRNSGPYAQQEFR